jgi:transcriptional regulator with XRE-family HTH domain
MQKQREVHGWTPEQTVKAFGCSAGHISRIEHGKMPSLMLVDFYDETFEADGLLLSRTKLLYMGPNRPVAGRAVTAPD